MYIEHFTGDIDTQTEVLEQHARDASVFAVTPSAVLYPKTVEDVVAVVSFANAQKEKGNDVSLSVRAGGSCMSGGSLHDGLILNLTKYMHTVKVDPVARTATVEMGAYFRDIESEAAKHGLMFAPYPSSKDFCGIGGMVGNNASGEKSVRHGATIDNVLSVTVVLGTGEVVTTAPKNLATLTSYEKPLADLAQKYGADFKTKAGDVHKVASGYRLDRLLSGDTFDATALFVGSQATLGVITSAVLRLVPIPQYTRLVLVPVDSIALLPEVLSLAKTMGAEAVETFDIHTFERAREFMKEDAGKIEKYIQPHTAGMILVEWSENSEAETQVKAEKYVETLLAKGVSGEVVSAEVSLAAWNIRRHSFSLVRDNHPEHMKAVPCIEDLIIPLDRFDTFVPRLVTILQAENLSYAYHGHIGDGSLRIIPLFDFTDPAVGEKIFSFSEKVFTLVKELGGNLSADHSDGIIRSPFLRDFYGEDLYQAFKQVKAVCDPHNIMNPHKKTGGTKEKLLKALDIPRL